MVMLSSINGREQRKCAQYTRRRKVMGTSDISNRILDAEEVELAERTRSVYPEPLYDAPGVELVAAGKRAELGALFIPTKADAAILQ